MLALEIIQAAFGDSLLLRFGKAQNPRFILIDGGPDQIYTRHLRHVLGGVNAEGGRIDLAVLSHVDRDHVTGLLDLFIVMAQKAASGQPMPIEIDQLWHNSFSDQIDPDGVLATRHETVVTEASRSGAPMTLAGMALLDIQQGHRLSALAHRLGISRNNPFHGRVAQIKNTSVTASVHGLQVHIVGPTRSNLEALRDSWTAWLDKSEYDLTLGSDPLVMAMADRSVPNLSSIMFMIEGEGKRMLFTGDGRGDHLLDGLETAGFLDANGNCHVDLLKVPHHGSDRNVTLGFFRQVTADRYVISADGKHGNPDLPTLKWIVQSAQSDNRHIEIWVTNRTDSVKALAAAFPPGAQSGYELKVLPSGQHSFRLDLA